MEALFLSEYLMCGVLLIEEVGIVKIHKIYFCTTTSDFSPGVLGLNLIVM